MSKTRRERRIGTLTLATELERAAWTPTGRECLNAVADPGELSVQLQRQHDLAGRLAAVEYADGFADIGERIGGVDARLEPAVRNPVQDLSMLARWPSGIAPTASPQNTPTAAQPLSSSRLSGILGISPAAKPTTRKRPCQAERAHRRLGVVAADAVVDDVDAVAAGQRAQALLEVGVAVVDRLVGAVLACRWRASPPRTRRR